MTVRSIYQRWLIAALMLTAIMWLSRGVWLAACGPFLVDIETVASIQPARLDSYGKGDLGIVRPRYARRYLVQAYRVLNGKPALPNIAPQPAASDTVRANREPTGFEQ